MERFTVIRDSSEKLGWYFDEDNCCLGTEISSLLWGDYSIKGLENKFTIERKRSVAEIAQNLTESRWPAFIEGISGIEYRFIILEFSIEDIMKYPSQLPAKIRYKIKITPDFILKKLTELQVNQKIPIIPCGSPVGAAKYAYSLMKRVREKFDAC